MRFKSHWGVLWAIASGSGWAPRQSAENGRISCFSRSSANTALAFSTNPIFGRWIGRVRQKTLLLPPPNCLSNLFRVRKIKISQVSCHIGSGSHFRAPDHIFNFAAIRLFRISDIGQHLKQYAQDPSQKKTGGHEFPLLLQQLDLTCCSGSKGSNNRVAR